MNAVSSPSRRRRRGREAHRATHRLGRVPEGRRRLGGRVQARTDAQLKRGIGEFYDESSGIWEEVWGEHMHHGYYREGEKPASFARHVEAQDDMIEKALELWLMTPNSISPLKYSGATTAAGRNVTR